MPTPSDEHRRLVEYSSDVVYRTDAEGRFTWVSPYVAEILGWSPDDLVGTSSIDVVHPDDVTRIAAGRDRAYGEGVTPEVKTYVRLRTKSGAYRWMLVRALTLISDDGTTEGLLGGLRDVDELMRERERARASEEHLRLIFDSQLDPHVTLAPVRDDSGRVVDFRHVDANAQALLVAGVPREDFLQAMMSDVMRPVGQISLIDEFAKLLETGQSLVIDAFEFLPLRGPGNYFLEVRAVPVEGMISLTFRDVTEAHNAVVRVTESERRFRLLAENTSDVILTVNLAGEIDWISPGASAILGWEPGAVIGSQFLQRVFDADRSELLTSRDAEVRLRLADGGYRWMRVRTRVIAQDQGITVYAAKDIQQEMEARLQLAHELGHDPLTGLTNRSEALARVEDALREVLEGEAVALLAVGLDDLRSVNEAFTHAAGDRVLVETARRLQAFAQAPDDLARVADNEFTVLVRHVRDEAGLAELAAAIQQDLSQEIAINTHLLDVSASVGIATAHGDSAVELLRDATTALHQARRRGGSRWEFIDPDMATAARERLIMRTGIREALNAGEFEAWLQPVVDLENEQVVGYEALARWRREGELISPADFIPVAESTDLIVALDRQILRKALAVVAEQTELNLGANMSAASLAAPDLVEAVVSTLAEFGVDPQRLNLEVTETSLLQPTQAVRDAMRELAELGVTWWVDDFGTGYSSIAHLRDLPVAGLKLDLSFTRDLFTDPTCARLAHGLVGLASGMGMATIAEGIETPEQAALLRDQGWEMGQGWLFGKPEPSTR